MINNKGYTLIEMIISLMIASIILVTVFQVFNMGLKVDNDIKVEYNEQSQIRYALENVNNTIRMSTVGFIVTKDDYNPTEDSSGNVTSGLSEGWSYVGLSPAKDKIVKYEYRYVDNDGDGNNDITGFDYIKSVLFESNDGIILDFEFNKVTDPQKDNLLEFSIVGEKDSEEIFSFKTEIDAINAIQILDRSGSGLDKGVAFAYRREKTPSISDRTVGALAMVLDKSGSMSQTIGTDIRINLLKETLNDPTNGLFATLKNSGSYVDIIPFSTNADSPLGFKNIDDQLSALKNNVNSLSALGGTNTGDGIKRAYYELSDFNNNPPSAINGDINNYIVVLVDGQTTMGALTGRKFGWWYRFDTRYPSFHLGRQNSGGIFKWRRTTRFEWDRSPYISYGNGNSLDDKYGEEYIRQVGNLIDNSSLDIEQAFVIGYSDNINDLKSLKNIATSLNISVSSNDPYNEYTNNEFVFVATDQDSLVEAFDNIGNYVKEDLWQVNGP